MTVRASVSIQDGVRDVGGGHKSRTGADCRVKGGRDSEVERISERKPSRRGREVKAEEKQGDGLGCEVQRVRRGISFSINRAEVAAEGGGGFPAPPTPCSGTRSIISALESAGQSLQRHHEAGNVSWCYLRFFQPSEQEKPSSLLRGGN